MWKFATVDGSYNVRQADGSIRSSTQKSARQLATVLLQSMNEVVFNVGLVPDDDYPTIEWNCTPSRSALSSLLSLYGMDVNLDWVTDTVQVVVRGVGAALPDNDDRINLSIGVDGSETPDAIAVCGDFTVVQSKLKMEAVGVETDGSIVPIDSLSYAPTDGWESENNPYDLVPSESETVRQLANSSVYRMFRVISQADGSQIVPNYSGTISDISQLFPLRNTLLDSYTVDIGVRSQSAYVSGVFMKPGRPSTLDNTDITTRLDRPFVLSEESGVVRFRDPVVKLNSSLQFVEPELYLTCSYNVQNATTGQYERYTLTRQISVSGTPTYAVPKTNLRQEIVASYESDGVTVASVQDNASTLGTEANAIIDSIQSQFIGASSAVLTYRGIQPLQTDGARRQITWSVSRHRKRPAPCYTVAAFNSEVDQGTLNYQERLRLLSAERSARQQDVDNGRVRAIRERVGVVI